MARNSLAHDPDEDVGDGGLLHRGAAHQDGRHREEAGLVVGVVGGHVAHVLQEDDLADGGQHRGDDDGDDAGAVHRHAGGLGHVHVVAHGPHVLAQLGLLEPDDEHAQGGDDQVGGHGQGEGPQVHRPAGCPGSAHLVQVQGVADAVAPRQDDRLGAHRDHRAHEVEHHELVDAVDEEGQDVAGDHLPALGLVEHHAADVAHEQGHRQAGQGREDQPVDPEDVVVDGQDQAELAGHGAQGHAEVEPHAGVDGQQQGQHQERVAAQPGEHLLADVGQGQPRGMDRQHGDDQEQEDDRVLPQEAAHGSLAAHLVTFVLRVRA